MFDDLEEGIFVQPADEVPDADVTPTVPAPAIPLPDAIYSYVGGAAGSGKSYLAREWATSYPGVELTSTTGISAINLGGRTVHSLLRYFDTPELQEKHQRGLLARRLMRLHEDGVRRIIVDEVSMLDARQLTCFVEAIDLVNADLEYVSTKEHPYEPMGMTLVGDFAQLPAIKAPFAFEAPEWARFADHSLMLDRVWRQDDPEFIAALRRVRQGDRTVASQYPWGFHQQADENFAGSTILAKNAAVDDYNQRRLAQLPGSLMTFRSNRWGDQEPEWAKHIPETLVLKPGALVMVLANRATYNHGEFVDYAYVNGDLGLVVDAVGSTCTVELFRTRHADLPTPPTTVWIQVTDKTEPLDADEAAELLADEQTAWQVKADEDQQHFRKVVGQITWMPLRLAFSTTVHKIQGLSLDAAQVNLHDPFFASPSMTYVALSRCRTRAGLRLVGGPLLMSRRMGVNPKVRGWL